MFTCWFAIFPMPWARGFWVLLQVFLLPTAVSMAKRMNIYEQSFVVLFTCFLSIKTIAFAHRTLCFMTCPSTHGVTCRQVLYWQDVPIHTKNMKKLPTIIFKIQYKYILHTEIKHLGHPQFPAEESDILVRLPLE
jgi:hypothetical protein